MSESSVAEVDLPQQPIGVLSIAEVHVAHDDRRVFVLAAGSGVERWRQIWGRPSSARWLSWQSLHALGDVVVLREVPPAPAAVGVEDGRREWVGVDGAPVGAFLTMSPGHVVMGVGPVCATLPAAAARELAATLLDLAGEAEAPDEVRETMRSWRAGAVEDPVFAALQRAVDCCG